MKVVKGIRISPGIVIGPVYFFTPGKEAIPQSYIAETEADGELEKFKRAADSAAGELEQVRALVLKHLDEDHARLIDAQLIALTDVDLVQEVTDLVRREHRNILWAYCSAMERYEKALVNSFNQFQQERMIDLHDVKKRIIHHLSTQGEYTIPQMREPAIYVSDRVSPSEMIHIHNQNTTGIITKFGGIDSHAGILARAFGIPYISNVAEIELIGTAREVILDADHEKVILAVTPAVLQEYQCKIRELEKRKQHLESQAAPAVSKNGVPVEILLNAGFAAEIKAVNPELIGGIGLFRTEYLCIERNDVPNEEEQFQAYRDVVIALKGKPATFRTFDFGREKMMAILDLEMFQKDAVFDTWGGIRFCLDNPWLLNAQLRALLRASHFGPLKIMFPLVTNPAEIRAVLEIYRQVQTDLKNEGYEFAAVIPLGAMIETKSILDELEELTGLLDFFSIGTNDLALFLLGSKRTDTVTKNYYHPMIFQAINRIAAVTRIKSFPVTVCGEMASDPYAVLGLLALGLRSFSMSASALITITDLVRTVNLKQVGSLQESLLSAVSAMRIYDLLRDYQQRNQKSKPHNQT